MPSIVGLEASLALFNEIGVDRICDQIKDNTYYLVSGLATLGATITSIREDGHWSGIVSFRLEKMDPMQVVAQCRSVGIVICCRGGDLRASPHFYNDRTEIDRLLQVLEQTRAAGSQ